MVHSRQGFAKAYLLVFMEGVSLGFLAGLKALSPNSSVKRCLMVDVLTSAPVSNKSDRIFLLEMVGEQTTIFFIMWSSLWLVTLDLPALCKSWIPPNVWNLMMAWWIAALLNFSFLEICLSEHHFHTRKFLTSKQLITLFLSMFLAAKLATILNSFVSNTTRLSKS